MKKTFRKLYPIFPKWNKKINKILEEKWYIQALFFTVLPIAYLVTVIVRFFLRIALIVVEARNLIWSRELIPNHHEHLANTYNALEISAIYFLSLFFKFGRYLRYCWTHARIARGVTVEGNPNAFSNDKGIHKLTVAFFILIQNIIAGIWNGIVAVYNFICNAFERVYRIKGTAIAIALIVFVFISALIGISADRNARKEFSLNAQCRRYL
jgi:hypothetical protein